MSEYNEVHITNDDPLPEMHYTNDDVPVNEHGTASENSGYSEFGSIMSSGGSEGSSPRIRQGDVAKVAATFAVVALVAFAVVLDDSPFGDFFNPVTGIISESFGIGDSGGYTGECTMDLSVTDTEIRYMVSFDTDPGRDIVLHVKDLFTDRTVDITESQSVVSNSRSGEITGLQKGMTYAVSVTVGSQTVKNVSVTTLDSYDERPEFTFVYSKCRCLDEPSLFYFMVHVIDRNSVWSDYHAELRYTDGSNPSVCQFTDDVNDEQTMSVTVHSSSVEAELVITCMEKADDGTVSLKTLYQNNVRI